MEECAIKNSWCLGKETSEWVSINPSSKITVAITRRADLCGKDEDYVACLRAQVKYRTVRKSSQGMPDSSVTRMPSTHHVERMMASTASPPRMVVRGKPGILTGKTK